MRLRRVVFAATGGVLVPSSLLVPTAAAEPFSAAVADGVPEQDEVVGEEGREPGAAMSGAGAVATGRPVRP